MRLLKIQSDGSLTVTADLLDKDLPPYAILSHTWGSEAEEVTLEDVINGTHEQKKGYGKLRFCEKQTAKDGLEFFWVDSSCIDRSNSTELSKAINSMFHWYRRANKCYVYLPDVSTAQLINNGPLYWESSFRASRWFTRGWTLQELLAPESVEFFSLEGYLLGDKLNLDRQLHEITAVPIDALRGGSPLEFSRSERMMWTRHRRTTVEEDMAYCLLGIFQVHMPLIYGEGVNNALRRLNEEIDKKEAYERGPDDELREILHWLSLIDESISHQIAQKSRLPNTCQWVFSSDQFINWTGPMEKSFLFLTASPGSGKTIVFGCLVDYFAERIASDSSISRTHLLAFFYFDFRNPDGQSLTHLLSNILKQLISQTGVCPDEILNFYRQTPGRAPSSIPSLKVLRKCIVDLCQTHHVWLLLDAVDESLDRTEIADFITGLLRDGLHIRVLITSRDDVELEETLKGGYRIRFDEYGDEIAGDIDTYIADRLQTSRRLLSLPENVRYDVSRSLHARSSGMFRWVQCQLDSIATLKTIRAIKGALDGLPVGLHDTYGRILSNVQPADQEMFRNILLWLSFSVLPLELEELADAIAIEPGSDQLDAEFRLTDAVDILSIGSSLVTITPSGSLRLAHLSVRDFLVSEEIRQNPSLALFALDATESHKQLAQHCLTYLSFREFHQGPARSEEAFQDRMSRYPLLRYASVGFSYHIREASLDENLRVMSSEFFAVKSRAIFLSWIQVLVAAENSLLWNLNLGDGAPLYYAASFGLTDVVKLLIAQGHDLNAPGGRFGGTALHAAVYRGHHDAMRSLLDAGADQSVLDESGYTPLNLASYFGTDNEAKRILEEYSFSRYQTARAATLNPR